jgi:hypothetical protein
MFDIKGFKQVATYCELTGNFYWNKGHNRAGSNCSSAHIGQGSHANHNFKVIAFKGSWVFAHRVVWFFHTGSLSDNERILFKNKNTLDTRIENLYSEPLKNEIHDNIRYYILKNGKERFNVIKPPNPKKTFDRLEDAIIYRDSLCTR